MLFHLQFTEHNGEQEYTHHHVIEAADMEEAKMQADEYMRAWYDDEDVTLENDTHYEFFCGQIIVEYDSLQAVTIEEFAKFILHHHGVDVDRYDIQIVRRSE